MRAIDSNPIPPAEGASNALTPLILGGSLTPRNASHQQMRIV